MRSHAPIAFLLLLVATSLTVTASIDGDPFTGLHHAPVFPPDATDYRPKWGLYRGINPSLHTGQDDVEDRNVSSLQILPEPAPLATLTPIALAPLHRRRRRTQTRQERLKTRFRKEDAYLLL